MNTILLFLFCKTDAGESMRMNTENTGKSLFKSALETLSDVEGAAGQRRGRGAEGKKMRKKNNI